ncbi:hypothetical protein [Streptomyces prunicolor]|uniref:hypothetical protein n=1 Tax=Streptomyces prunicolor TaxID=67348 RepID=UPI003413A5F8
MARSDDADAQGATTGNTRRGSPQGEIAGLVLLINTILGGLGTMYVTTKSAAITVVSALQVLLVIVAVLVAKRRDGHGDRPDRKDDRGGG